MNAIAEITRIEADLYRFTQTTSEAPRLIHEYLGGVLKTGYVSEVDHAAEIDELKNDLETAQEEAEKFRKIVESFRDSIQDTKFLPYQGPEAFLALIGELVNTMAYSSYGLTGPAARRINDDLSSIESYLEEQSESVPEIQTPRTSDIERPTSNIELKDINHEKQTDRHHPAACTPRRLPGIGKRAA